MHEPFSKTNEKEYVDFRNLYIKKLTELENDNFF